MKVGLIDVDAKGKPKFPNLALMRISAWHKAQGDEVEWWWSDFIHYDIVYMSKIFSDAYSKDVPEPMNADKVIKGGTGYCISLDRNGKEVFDQSKNQPLPPPYGKIVPGLFHLSAVRFCRKHDEQGLSQGMRFLSCGRQGRAVRGEGRGRQRLLERAGRDTDT